MVSLFRGYKRYFFGMVMLGALQISAMDFKPGMIQPSALLIENDKTDNASYNAMLFHLNNLDDRFDQSLITLAYQKNRKAQILLREWTDCRGSGDTGLYEAWEELSPEFQSWVSKNANDPLAGFAQYPQYVFDTPPTKQQVNVLITAANAGQPNALYALAIYAKEHNQQDVYLKYLVDAASKGEFNAIEEIALLKDPKSSKVSKHFTKNVNEAAYLYWYAARHTMHQEAKERLSEMFAQGYGVQKNYILAYALNLLAHNAQNFCFSTGYSASSDYYEGLSAKRKKLSKMMKSSDIDKAVKMVKNPSSIFELAKSYLLYIIVATDNMPAVIMTATESKNSKMSDTEYLNYKQINPEYALADKELNQAFSALRKRLNESDKNKLKAEQNTWILYRDKQLIKMGQKGTKSYMDGLIQMTHERTQYLKNSI